MQLPRALLAGLLAAAAAPAAATGNPLAKVFELLDSLAGKIRDDGTAEEREYHAYFEWCDDVTRNAENDIKTSSADKERLDSAIQKLASDAEVAKSKIGELAGLVSKSEKELAEAGEIRKQEAAEFKAGEKELLESTDALARAIGVLSKKGGSLAQLDSASMAGALQALSTIIDGAAFSAADRAKLAAFVQSQAEGDDDGPAGAPSAAAYESHSGGVVEVLEDLKEKAETELGSLRKGESESRHNYNMLKQSLEDQIAADKKDMESNKLRLAAAHEQRATAESELAVATKDLASSQQALATSQSTCMQVAADHEATVAARGEELKVLEEAKKVLKEAGNNSGSVALLQVAAAARSNSPVVAAVRKLARAQHSAALAQLASRIATVIRLRGGGDPFEKVRSMIESMIGKLQSEATAAANEKAYCDEQMSKTSEKQGELSDDVAKMTAQVDKAASSSARLKREVQQLQAELGALTKQQAEADQIRQAGHKDFLKTKADLEQGLTAVRSGLTLLRDYYASDDQAAFVQEDDDSKFEAFMQQPARPAQHKKAEGAGASIVGLLEVVESDLATSLAKEETEESDAQSDYEKMTQENKVTIATKQQDAKYKTQESKGLDTSIAEVSADRATANQELGAVEEYGAQLQARCVAKPETYEERSKRRAAEIAGLREALAALESEAALVQRHSRRHARRHMRGAALAAGA